MGMDVMGVVILTGIVQNVCWGAGGNLVTQAKM